MYVCTVVQAVVKANSQSNGNGQISTTRGAKTPERMLMKPKIYNYIVFMTTHANPCGGATTWVVSANTWHVTCFGFLGDLFSVFFYFWDCSVPSPTYRFWRSIRHMACFHAKMWLLRARCCYSPFMGLNPPPNNRNFGAWMAFFGPNVQNIESCIWPNYAKWVY